MSIQAVTKFLEKAHADTALGDQVKSVIAERGEESSFELVELAAKHDFEFTATEFMQCVATGNANAELSEAELEAVAGGISYLRTILGRKDNPFGDGIMLPREKDTGPKP